MRFPTFHILLYLFLCSLSSGLHSCTAVSSEENEEYSITLMALTSADSATVANKALGLARYIYIDLNNDSVIYFRKTLSYDANSKYIYTKNQVTGRMKDISTNAYIQQFSQHLEKATVSKLSPDIKEGVLYCGFTFIALLKKGKTEKAFYFSTYEASGIIQNVTNLMLTLSDWPVLHSTTPNISEDSILVPLLSRPELSFIPPGIPPSPSPTPPPPPVFNE